MRAPFCLWNQSLGPLAHRPHPGGVPNAPARRALVSVAALSGIPPRTPRPLDAPRGCAQPTPAAASEVVKEGAGGTVTPTVSIESRPKPIRRNGHEIADSDCYLIARREKGLAVSG